MRLKQVNEAVGKLSVILKEAADIFGTQFQNICWLKKHHFGSQRNSGSILIWGWFSSDEKRPQWY